MGQMASALIVVIATAGRPGLLRRTLESLAACRKPDVFHRTIIVENGSKRGAEEVVRFCHPSLNAHYIYQSEGNKCLALNKSLEMVTDSLIFFTDDDVRIHPNTLCAYAEAAAGIEGGQFYGGPAGIDCEQQPAEWLKSYLPLSARGWNLGGRMEAIDRPLFLGFNWAAFAKDLRAAGGFDPNLGPGAPSGSYVGDETEMQCQLLNKGVKAIYVPKAMVWHYVPAERCRPLWVIKRAYRIAIYHGVSSPKKGPTIFGIPRWAIRAYATRGLEVMLKAATGDAQARFAACYNFMRICGYIRGSRFARKKVDESL